MCKYGNGKIAGANLPPTAAARLLVANLHFAISIYKQCRPVTGIARAFKLVYGTRVELFSCQQSALPERLKTV